MTSPSNSQSEDDTINNNPNPDPVPPVQDDEEIQIPQQQQQLDSAPAETLDHPPQDQLQDDLGDPDLPAGQVESGMSLSPIRLPDEDVPVNNVNPPSLTSPTNNPTNNPNRRINKRKKLNPRRLKNIEKKVQTLVSNLVTVPFKPAKRLDFDRHAAVLKRLGLWDFVRIEFDTAIREDLIAQLVVNYDSSKRCSYVNDKRILANRADLSRCFRLPVVKKEKGSNVVEEVDLDSEEYSDDDKAFIEEFVLNWMIINAYEAWEMPVEVSNSIRLVKDGHPERVDWAGLLWQMVEKELVQGDRLKRCYYASHLQYLIKWQCGEVFFEEESHVEMEVEVKEDVDGGEGNQNSGVEENVVREEPNIVLTLGQDLSDKEQVKEDDDMMDVEECKDAELNNWFNNGKNNLGGHMLQRCDLVGSSVDVFEDTKQEEEHGGDEEEDEEVEDEEEDGFEIVPNDDSLDREGLTGNFIQGMETTHIPFGLQGQLRDQSSVDPFASNSNEGTYMMSGQPLFFGHGGKREMEPEHDMSHYSLNTSNKRMRTDGLWEPNSSDFGTCMDQLQHMVNKAKMIYESKEQTYQESQSCQQQLLDQLQQRNDLIEHLRRSKDIEIEKKDDEILRLENELYLMANLLEGYKKAMKDTQKAFSEYRHRYQLSEEPIYKDAGGGLVLSTTEIERRRLKQEEEDRLKRLFLQQKGNEYLEECMHTFQIHYEKLITLDKRLVEYENTVNLLKESSAQQRAQKCQDVPQINDASLQNPSGAGELPVHDGTSPKLSDVTDVQATDVQVNTTTQSPLDASELQANDTSSQNPSDATELQEMEVACDLVTEAQ